ncbi:helix-turn-helix domain-containing protein [Myroides odoratus]|uniref:helix-turn-helix domain-containing protein n=1 Tax=Myroides odoratus TaxID=256 RepID=UPI0039B03F60
MQLYLLIYAVLTLITSFKFQYQDYFYSIFSEKTKSSETAEKILTFFENKKNLFLKRNFTILILSQTIDIPIHKVSYQINNELYTNFYTLLAYHRILHAKQLLLDKPNYKIEVIANECGFNSTVTFAKYFKQFVNCSPTEFRSANGLKL